MDLYGGLREERGVGWEGNLGLLRMGWNAGIAWVVVD